MRTLILSAALTAFSFGSFAGGPSGNGHDDKYCAKMKDGKLVLMHKGEALATDATLDNGAVVKPDGSVLMKDGTNLILSDGECIHKDGTTSMKRNKSTAGKS